MLTFIQTPFALNTLALLQFVTYGILIVPINFYWQRALEARYPGFPSRAEIGNVFRCSSRSCSLKSIFSFIRSLFSSSASDDTLPSSKDKEKWAPRARKSGLHSFMMKFLLDQTIAGVMNIVLFIVLIHFLKGETLKRLWELVLEVCLACPHSWLAQMLICVGFPSYHDCKNEVSSCCLYFDVYRHTSRPSGRFCQCLRGYLGYLP